MPGVKGRSGGARLGAGRKRRDPKASWLAGAKVVKPGPRAVVPPTEDAACPADATADVKAVWKDLAPHALAERTLTTRTALAFAILCQNIVFERKLAASALAACGPDHRGMLARVENGMARFRLIADGKTVAVDTTAQDEWSEFDSPMQIIRGGKS